MLETLIFICAINRERDQPPLKAETGFQGFESDLLERQISCCFPKGSSKTDSRQVPCWLGMCVGVIPLTGGSFAQVLRHVLDLPSRCCKATEDLVLCSQEVSDSLCGAFRTWLPWMGAPDPWQCWLLHPRNIKAIN